MDSSSIAYALDLVNISKSFKRATKKGSYTTLKSELLRFWKDDSSDALVNHAISDITMRVPKGASVGIIGRNGSGKSTLLKLITGIYKPDSGKISVNGRISALIELGAGFHPDFTGRENVFLSAIMQGMSRAEVKDKFRSIVEFSELQDVIDDPVRTYSSGMFMRLGFSVAIHAEPDVLLIDEVLAVGDAGFVAKCRERIASLKKAGKTLMLVAHDLDSIERWSDEVLWIDKGVIQERGEPRRVIDAYRTFIEKGEEREKSVEELSSDTQILNTDATSNASRWGSREIEIEDATLRAHTGEEKLLFHPDDSVEIEITYKVNSHDYKDIVFGMGFERADGISVFGVNTHVSRVEIPPLRNSGRVILTIPRIGLLEGSFSLDVAVHREDGYPYDYRKGIKSFLVRSPNTGVGFFCASLFLGFRCFIIELQSKPLVASI